MNEPTAAEKQLRGSVRRAVSADERVAEILTDNLAGMDAWVDAVLDVALPLVEARLREQIAAEIEASPREGQYAPDWHAAGRRAAKIARGR